VIERLLDHFEAMMAQQNGDMIYHLGPFSRWGSIFNAVVSGLILVGGVVAAINDFQPFFIMFIVIGAALNTFFVLIAVRVHNGRTLYDRELAAQLAEEESSGADEAPPR
jgi:hypothetical protein